MPTPARACVCWCAGVLHFSRRPQALAAGRPWWRRLWAPARTLEARSERVSFSSLLELRLPLSHSRVAIGWVQSSQRPERKSHKLPGSQQILSCNNHFLEFGDFSNGAIAAVAPIARAQLRLQHSRRPHRNPTSPTFSLSTRSRPRA